MPGITLIRLPVNPPVTTEAPPPSWQREVIKGVEPLLAYAGWRKRKL